MYNACLKPECEWAPVPEDPNKLQGPELGAKVIYNDPSFPRWDGMEYEVKARSYVWSPEKHGPNGHGIRHYDWTVIRNEGGGMVVDDNKLTLGPVRLSDLLNKRARKLRRKASRS